MDPNFEGMLGGGIFGSVPQGPGRREDGSSGERQRLQQMPATSGYPLGNALMRRLHIRKKCINVFFTHL